MKKSLINVVFLSTVTQAIASDEHLDDTAQREIIRTLLTEEEQFERLKELEHFSSQRELSQFEKNEIKVFENIINSRISNLYAIEMTASPEE